MMGDDDEPPPLPPCQVANESMVQTLVENIVASSRTEVDRIDLFELMSLYSDLYFNATQVQQ